MSIPKPEKQSAKKPSAVRRRAVNLLQEELVEIGQLYPGKGLPILIRPRIRNIDLLEWVGFNGQKVEELLLKHGAILFRNCNVNGVDDLERFIESTSLEWAFYREPATPRKQVSATIFTSTEYPPEQTIFLHNENSHCDSWPSKIYFFCVTPPERGGETPVADCRRIYQRLSPLTKRRFIEKKVMYVRNFGDGLGFSWQEVFGAADRAGVERYCRDHAMTAEWKSDDRLRVRYVREAVASHRLTGEPVWFNHATFFHVSTLERSTRDSLLANLGEQDLPYNTFYGDGSPIEPEVLDELRQAYHQETVSFPYEKGDLLMLDNMLVAHGRAPYSGPRKILVGMADPIFSKNNGPESSQL